MFAIARLLSEMCSPIARFMGMGQSLGTLTPEAEEEDRASKPLDGADDGQDHRLKAGADAAEHSERGGLSRKGTKVAMAPLPLALASAGMGSLFARSGENRAAFKSSKVWEDDMNTYFRTRFMLLT